MNIISSFFALAKHNNGKFRSELQANFLRSKLDSDDSYTEIVKSLYNNLVSFTVFCDETGIIKITKQAEKSGKKSVYFERKTDQEFTDQQNKKAQELAQAKTAKIEVIQNLINHYLSGYNSALAENVETIDKVKAATNDNDMINSLAMSLHQITTNKFKPELMRVEQLKKELDQLIAN